MYSHLHVPVHRIEGEIRGRYERVRTICNEDLCVQLQVAVIGGQPPCQDPRQRDPWRPCIHERLSIVAAIGALPLVNDDGCPDTTVYGEAERRDDLFDNAFPLVAGRDPIADDEDIVLRRPQKLAHDLSR